MGEGQVYVDEQTYKMPDGVQGPDSTVYVGIWKGDARLRIVSGPNDGDNRAIVGKIKTGVARSRPNSTRSIDIPDHRSTSSRRVTRSSIDGKGDEKAWGGAASTGPFVDVGTGKPNTSFPVNGIAKLLWDDENLYVLFEVTAGRLSAASPTPRRQPNDFTAAGQPKLWTRTRSRS